MMLLVLFALAGYAAAACTEPAPYYTISLEMAAAYFLNPNDGRVHPSPSLSTACQPSRSSHTHTAHAETITGGNFATLVRDTANLRVYTNFYEIFDRWGDMVGESWMFYDPSGNPDNTTFCSRVNGQPCYCGKAHAQWSPLVPPTAYVTGKRNLLSNTPAYVYNNDTNLHFVEIVADDNCVLASYRAINRYDLGYDMGGSLTSYYNYAPLTAAQIESYFMIPPDCQLPPGDADTPAKATAFKPHFFF